ncbi:hypothetical protein ACP4OV_008566 [Aristida adscensionis]
MHKLRSLRTLMLFGSTTVGLKDLLGKLSSLRILLLRNVDLAELPNSINHLKHLRYLGLHGTSISSLPQGIEDLTFLQVIELAGCTNLSQLPNRIIKLRKLRTINLSGSGITSVPRGFGKLEDLINIGWFPTNTDDSDGWCSLEELGPLSKLTDLYITGVEKASSGSLAARAKLSSKYHLKILWLTFTSRLRDNGEIEDNISEEEHKRIEGVLANLCPPTCIELLEIRGYFGRGLPKWTRTMPMFGSLRRLVLDNYACCVQLPNGLGQLPFLEYFWVERSPSIQCIGHDLFLPPLGGDGDGKGKTSVTGGTGIDRRPPHRISCGAGVAFPKLRNLGFKGMPGWIEWEWEQHVPGMTALELLTINSCKNFSSLVELMVIDNPRLERVSGCPSLQKITIGRCPMLKVLENLPSLRSMEWNDLDAEAFPEYLTGSNLNRLQVYCSLSLLKLIALQDDTSEWGKIKHVQQLKAFRWKSKKGKADGHIYYTREPYSFEAEMGESSDEEEEEETQDVVEEEDMASAEGEDLTGSGSTRTGLWWSRCLRAGSSQGRGRPDDASGSRARHWLKNLAAPA